MNISMDLICCSNLVIGILLILFSFVVNANNNFSSKVVFKFCPFVFGSVLVYIAGEIFKTL